MILITGLIAPQAFEVVRDQVGAILAEEMHNQSVLDGNNPEIDPVIWVERFIPFDRSELPAVNVTLAKGQIDGTTVAQSDGMYTYNIDVYSKAKETAGEKADKTAMLRLQRILGLCRAILMDAQYKTLGFAPPFVMMRQVNSLSIAEPDQRDAASSVMGRVTLQVKVPEITALLVPQNLAQSNTQVKLEETDKGFYYSFVTP